MKKRNSSLLLHLVPLILGVLGFCLRLWLYGTGVDEKGLLITSHPANALVLAVLAVGLAFSGLFAMQLPGRKQSKPFPPSEVGGIGCFVAAAGIVIGNILELKDSRELFTILSFAIGLLAAGCFVLVGLGRRKGQHSSLLSCCITCAYFMIHLVCQYRLWSSEPQLQEYIFPLLASVMLMLCCYYRAQLDIRGKGLGWYVFCNRAALVCCLCALNTGSWAFYLSMAIWTVADLHIPAPQGGRYEAA